MKRGKQGLFRTKPTSPAPIRADRPPPRAAVDHPALSGRCAGLARREREAGAPVELTVVAETERQNLGVNMSERGSRLQVTECPGPLDQKPGTTVNPLRVNRSAE